MLTALRCLYPQRKQRKKQFLLFFILDHHPKISPAEKEFRIQSRSVDAKVMAAAEESQKPDNSRDQQHHKQEDEDQKQQLDEEEDEESPPESPPYKVARFSSDESSDAGLLI